MLVGFLVDLTHAPLSPDICGGAAGIYDTMVLHLDLLPSMHLAMLIGVVDMGGRDWRTRLGLGLRGGGRFVFMAAGMVLGGALLMPAQVAGVYGWWWMCGTMLAGMAGGHWVWAACYAVAREFTMRSAASTLRRLAKAPTPAEASA
ncbi:hypothetical protein [Mesorhizobium sp.]|jgi:hypothetical protein|uniref:hypothetical protein n=1 Tax=Mesorhizobium sp. TaxID=1871066 RepID=UPI00356A5236